MATQGRYIMKLINKLEIPITYGTFGKEEVMAPILGFLNLEDSLTLGKTWPWGGGGRRMNSVLKEKV